MVGETETGTADAAKLTDIEMSPSKDQQDDETGFRQDVEKLLLCPVCHELVTDPRKLNCGHFLCFECVQLLEVDEAIACPKCSSRMTVPESGIKEDELAAQLVQLLAQFHARTEKTQNGQSQVNGCDKYMDEEEDDSESDSDSDSTSENEETSTEDADDTLPDAKADTPPTSGISDVITVNAPTEALPDATETPATSAEKPQMAPTENVEVPEIILDPPKDYQSPDEEGPDNSARSDSTTTVELREPVKEPVEHSEETDKIKEETKDVDEPDRVMKASEMKPSDAVALGNEASKQCEECSSTKCTCNIPLMKPPTSNGSQLSIETTTSNSPSECDETDIPVKKIAKFSVASASNIEVANRNRVYVTKWSYDDKGSVETYDCSGNKIKFVHAKNSSFGGITISRLGFIFVINTTKNRIEEFSGADGKKVKDFKLSLCADAYAVDILPTGEVIVVDQEKNRVVIYPNAKKSSSQPKILKNELIKNPHDVAACADGFYITCLGSRCLLKMDLDGNIVWKHSGQADDSTKESGIFHGVCTDESGNVYVVDRENEAVIVLTKDGELKGRIRVRERAFKGQRPWFISVRDTILAVLFSHNTVRTYQLVN